VRAPRRVAVEAGAGGYAPSTIDASPGEALLLVFTRTSPGECLAQVRVGDGAPVDLPLGQPVEIAVTAPASGRLGFACGMDMATGTVVVQ
jgi:plastocyanin domain-containing protein